MVFQKLAVVLEFTHIKPQCRQHKIRTTCIIAFETVPAQNGVWGKSAQAIAWAAWAVPTAPRMRECDPHPALGEWPVAMLALLKLWFN